MIRIFHSIHHNQFRNVCKRLPRNVSRQFSSLVPSNNDADKQEDNDNLRLLYQRDQERNRLPRTSFLVSSLNSIYWIWYVVDFVPAVNASPIDSFHIDPIYGFGGLGLSILIQSAFTLYPLSLVSKIAYRTPASNSVPKLDDGRGKKNSTMPQQQDILVWKHTLPLLRTSSEPLIFPAGGVGLDKTAENTRMILEDLGGNIGKFEGFLGLKKVPGRKMKNGGSSLTSNLPLLVDIRKSSEVCDSESMLHILLSGGNRKRRSAEERDEQYQKKFHHQLPKYRKKKRNRGKKH